MRRGESPAVPRLSRLWRRKQQNHQDPDENLPIRRRRELTAALPEQSGLKHRTYMQSKSLFFTRLPLEIRLLVYDRLFGSRTVHPELFFNFPDYKWDIFFHLDLYRRKFFRKTRLQFRHDVCYRAPGTDFWQDICSWSSGERLGISILSTCRRAYSESIEILYGANTFHFEWDYIFSEFHSRVLPSSFESITSIELLIMDCCGHSNKISYTAIWQCLASLPNLRRLWVAITGWEHGPYDERPLWFDEDCLSPIDRLVCKQGHMMDNVRLLVSYSHFRILDKRGEELLKTSDCEPTEDQDEDREDLRIVGKFRRLVGDGTNQWSYWIECLSKQSL